MPPKSANDPTKGTLGNLLFVYRPRPLNQVLRWAWFVGGVIVGTGLLGYGGFLVVSISVVYGPVPAISRGGPWLVGGGIFLLICLLGCWFGYVKKQPAVHLHVKGLCIKKRSMLVLPWDQINGITSGTYSYIDPLKMTRAVSYKASIFPVKGRPVHLHGSKDGKGGIVNLHELVQRIKKNLYPNLRSEYARMFRSGLPLYFGPVEISQAGMKLRRKIPFFGMRSARWDSVKRITVQAGYFLVELEQQPRRGKGLQTYRLPVAKIPNLELLLKIIDQGVER